MNFVHTLMQKWLLIRLQEKGKSKAAANFWLLLSASLVTNWAFTFLIKNGLHAQGNLIA